MDPKKPPLRMQVALTTEEGSFLVFEVIGEFDMFCPFQRHNYSAAYANEMYRRGLPAGGSVIQRADKPRVWDVPVGGRIR